MNIRRFVLTCLLFCLGAADQLFARTTEILPTFQSAAMLPDATILPAFQIAVLLCLGSVLCFSLFWVSVLKLVRLDVLEQRS